MKYGLDVLASDIPASHLIDLDEQNYFEKGNVNILSSKLQKKMTSFQKINYELSEYDWREIVKQVTNLYWSIQQ